MRKNLFGPVLSYVLSFVIAGALCLGIGAIYGTPAGVATFLGLNAACHLAVNNPAVCGSLFQQLVETLPTQSGIVVGQKVRFVLPRDFPLEGFVIVVEPTVSGVAATIAPEGCFAFVQNVRLTANDGGQNRDLVNADSMSIVQRHLAYNSNLDTETLTAFGNAFSSATAKVIRIPHFFPPNSMEDPARSLFLQNFPRFNNDPILEIQIGTQAQIDTHATPTFTISACTIRVILIKRYVTSDKWNFLKTDFITQEQAYTLNAAAQRYNLPVPGWHFGIGMRMYSSATALGDISQTAGVFKIQALNVVERVLQSTDVRALNQISVPADVTAAGVAGVQRNLQNSSTWFDYLTDLNGASVTNLDTLLNSNPFAALGTVPQVLGDINGAAGKKIVFMHDRCYGDLSPALALPRMLGKAA